MPTCPRCQKPVPQTAIDCPNCHLALKAHGHPGMTLYRAQGSESLCATCAYDADNSCTFSKRPNATTCTLYQDISQSNKPSETYRPLPRPWWYGNTVWIALAVLIAASLAIALLPVIL